MAALESGLNWSIPARQHPVHPEARRRPTEPGFDVSKYVQRAPKPNLTS